MNDNERLALESFAGQLLIDLNLADLPLDIDQILNLAGDAARTIVRPAAPLTTFLVGYAAGRRASAGNDPAHAITEAAATAVVTANTAATANTSASE